MYIYKITNTLNGKIYVGKTKRKKFRVRFGNHKSALRHNKHKNKHLQYAWNKYGEASFSFEIIEKFDNQLNFDLNNLERYWIKHYDSMNPAKGYNKTEGGDGCLGFKFTEEQNREHSKRQKDFYQTEEGKAARVRQSKSLEVFYKTEEGSQVRNNISLRAKAKVGELNSFFGKTHTDNTRAKLKKSWTDERKEKNRVSKGKTIICLNNNIVYNSSTEAAEKLKLKPSSIRSVLQGKAKALKGYKFEYYNEVLNVQAV